MSQQTERDEPRVRPRAIQIEASSACQLKCPSCPTASGATHAVLGRGFLQPDDLAALLDANPDIRQVELSNYGEMFLNPRLAELMRLCRARDVEITANNGANLNQARPEMLAALVENRLRLLTVSIDGATQETYAQYRVGGSFAAVIANVVKINALKRRARSEFPKLRWQFVVFGHNEHEIDDARAMAETLGMEFFPKLSWTEDFSPVRDRAAVRLALPHAASSRAEFAEVHGQDYVAGICHQLWDSPQVNWDGKLLGCCRNFWGDFGANVFTDGFVAAVNGERIAHARAMLRGAAAARDDVPCSTCDIYRGMAARGTFLTRDDIARGQAVSLADAVTLAAGWAAAGRIAEAQALCHRVLGAEPMHPGALRLFSALERRAGSTGG